MKRRKCFRNQRNALQSPGERLLLFGGKVGTAGGSQGIVYLLRHVQVKLECAIQRTRIVVSFKQENLEPT